MIDRRLENIITHCRHQLTNAVAEGVNIKIMAIERREWPPERRQLQGRDLLLLRRITALPMKIPDGPDLVPVGSWHQPDRVVYSEIRAMSIAGHSGDPE